MSTLSPKRRIQFQDRHRLPGEPVETCIREDVYTIYMPLSSGTVRSYSDGKVLVHGDLHPGMARIAVPGERFQAEVLTPIELAELTIPGETLRKAFTDAGFIWPSEPVPLRPLLKPNRVIAALASALRSAPEADTAQRQIYLEGLTQALFACLGDSRHLGLELDARVSVRPLNDQQFLRCEQFAMARAGSKLSLDEWSASLGMGAGEFSRAFKKRTRQSPYAWYLDRRIELSKQLLLDPTSSLTEVALGAGFCSQSHFTEAFRRRVGCSPTRWQRSIEHTNPNSFDE